MNWPQDESAQVWHYHLAKVYRVLKGRYERDLHNYNVTNTRYRNAKEVANAALNVLEELQATPFRACPLVLKPEEKFEQDLHSKERQHQAEWKAERKACRIQCNRAKEDISVTGAKRILFKKRAIASKEFYHGSKRQAENWNIYVAMISEMSSFRIGKPSDFPPTHV
ncbi:hypothetical protein MMC21_006310 [Puttea exsequens]|nr:hypothetical protein [Puttea exsequens]